MNISRDVSYAAFAAWSVRGSEAAQTLKQTKPSSLTTTMAGEAWFVKFLYGLALYLFILECFYPFKYSFVDPESYVSKALVFQTKSLSVWFETWSFYTLMVYITWFIIKYTVKAFALVVFYFRPALREIIKERIRKRREARKLEGKADKSRLVTAAFVLFLPIVGINGAVFNRQEGTPLAEGAINRYLSTAQEHLPIFLIELAAFLVVAQLVLLFVALRAYFRGTRKESPSSVEEGLLEETREVPSIYAATTVYLEASIFDEKLVHIDESALLVEGL